MVLSSFYSQTCLAHSHGNPPPTHKKTFRERVKKASLEILNCSPASMHSAQWTLHTSSTCSCVIRQSVNYSKQSPQATMTRLCWQSSSTALLCSFQSFCRAHTYSACVFSTIAVTVAESIWADILGTSKGDPTTVVKRTGLGSKPSPGASHDAGYTE